MPTPTSGGQADGFVVNVVAAGCCDGMALGIDQLTSCVDGDVAGFFGSIPTTLPAPHKHKQNRRARKF